MLAVNIKLTIVIIKILTYKKKLRFLFKENIFAKKIISNAPIAKIIKYELFRLKSNRLL
jgi:hypothetical protein